MSRHVYKCRPSLEEERPEIDFQDWVNVQNDWLAVAEVLDGTRSETDYPAVNITVRDPNALEWDCYQDTGSGLFSERFLATVGDEALQRFTLFPARLNEAPYFFLRCNTAVDCLNLHASRFKTFKHDPSRIMQMLSFTFYDDRVPEYALFCIPETTQLLATESVASRIRGSTLKGVRLIELQ